MKKGIVTVRDLASDGGPSIPSEWESKKQDNNWWILVSPSGSKFFVYRENINNDETQGLYATLGEDWEFLKQYASSSSFSYTFRELWTKRAESVPKAILRRLRTWWITGWERDENGDPVAINNVKRTIMKEEGHILPDPTVVGFPIDIDENGQLTTQASASFRISEFHRPGLDSTIAGHNNPQEVEDTEEDFLSGSV